MSRDFTPLELFIADKWIEEKNGHGLRDTKMTYTLLGKEVEVPEKTSKNVFPELSFLFDPFEELFKCNLDSKAAQTVFKKAENIIEELEQFELTKGSKTERQLLLEEKARDVFFDTAAKWFYGKLDSGFYYHEKNDELFGDFLLAEIEKEKAHRQNQVEKKQEGRGL